MQQFYLTGIDVESTYQAAVVQKAALIYNFMNCMAPSVVSTVFPFSQMLQNEDTTQQQVVMFLIMS